MNMTSAEQVDEVPAEQKAPAMTPEEFRKFQEKLANIQNNPDYLRYIKNRQRVQDNYDNIMAMTPEDRAKLLFTVYCHRMTAWNESVERRAKKFVSESLGL